MKKLLFAIYAFFFNVHTKLPVKEDRVALVSMHNAHFKDGLGEVQKQMEKMGEYEFVYISRTDLDSFFGAIKFCTTDAIRLARSKYVFLNDNFMPLAKLNPSKETKIIQLWHGQGAFKKFGLDIEVPEEIRNREIKANEKLSYVVCSSNGVRDIYASAFGVPPEKVISTGTPNEDFYFKPYNLGDVKKKLAHGFPSCTDKFVVLYAPTFRENEEQDANLLANMDFKRLKESFGENVEILVRLHPQVHRNNIEIKDAIDASDVTNINGLCLACDLLITDYSSICMDFALMKKPMIFYAFDLDDYKESRNFYFDYETYVPGRVARNMDELCEIASSGDFAMDKNEKFRFFNFGIPIGEATTKLLEQVL